MEQFDYENPVKIRFGKGVLEELGTLVQNKKVLLVYGSSSLKKSGAYDRIVSELEKGGNTVVDFGGISAPSYQKILEGIKIVQKEGISAVVGAGGCTAMDMAKIIAFGAVNPGLWSYLQLEKDPSGKKHLFTVEIPTYPSGGSEVDAAAECDDEATGKHGSLYGSYPDVALIDPELSYSLNGEMTAYSGFVSFCQLSTNYIGNTSVLVKGMIEKALKELLNATEKAMKEPEDYEARASLSWGSVLSTQGFLSAFNYSNLGGAIYGMEGVAEEYGPMPYRKAIALYFPRFLVLLARWHPAEIRDYCVHVLDVDPELDAKEAALAGEEKLIEWGESHSLTMYIDELGFPYDERKLYALTYAGDEYSHRDLFESFQRCFKRLH